MLGNAFTRSVRYRWFAGAVATGTAPGGTSIDAPGTATALFRAALGAVAVMAVVRLEFHEPPIVALVTLIVAAWLCLGSLFDVAAVKLMRLAASMRRGPSIPLRFSGPTGRFLLRRLSRSRVEVRAGSELVAEVAIHDLGDELVVYDVAPLAEAELPELGSAIGQAMELMVAASRTEGGHHNPFE